MTEHEINAIRRRIPEMIRMAEFTGEDISGLVELLDGLCRTAMSAIHWLRCSWPDMAKMVTADPNAVFVERPVPIGPWDGEGE